MIFISLKTRMIELSKMKTSWS